MPQTHRPVAAWADNTNDFVKKHRTKVRDILQRNRSRPRNKNLTHSIDHGAHEFTEDSETCIQHSVTIRNPHYNEIRRDIAGHMRDLESDIFEYNKYNREKTNTKSIAKEIQAEDTNTKEQIRHVKERNIGVTQVELRNKWKQSKERRKQSVRDNNNNLRNKDCEIQVNYELTTEQELSTVVKDENTEDPTTCMKERNVGVTQGELQGKLKHYGERQRRRQIRRDNSNSLRYKDSKIKESDKLTTKDGTNTITKEIQAQDANTKDEIRCVKEKQRVRNKIKPSKEIAYNRPLQVAMTVGSTQRNPFTSKTLREGRKQIGRYNNNSIRDKDSDNWECAECYKEQESCTMNPSNEIREGYINTKDQTRGIKERDRDLWRQLIERRNERAKERDKAEKETLSKQRYIKPRNSNSDDIKETVLPSETVGLRERVLKTRDGAKQDINKFMRDKNAEGVGDLPAKEKSSKSYTGPPKAYVNCISCHARQQFYKDLQAEEKKITPNSQSRVNHVSRSLYRADFQPPTRFRKQSINHNKVDNDQYVQPPRLVVFRRNTNETADGAKEDGSEANTLSKLPTPPKTDPKLSPSRNKLTSQSFTEENKPEHKTTLPQRRTIRSQPLYLTDLPVVPKRHSWATVQEGFLLRNVNKRSAAATYNMVPPTSERATMPALSKELKKKIKFGNEISTSGPSSAVPIFGLRTGSNCQTRLLSTSRIKHLDIKPQVPPMQHAPPYYSQTICKNTFGRSYHPPLLMSLRNSQMKRASPSTLRSRLGQLSSSRRYFNHFLRNTPRRTMSPSGLDSRCASWKSCNTTVHSSGIFETGSKANANKRYGLCDSLLRKTKGVRSTSQILCEREVRRARDTRAMKRSPVRRKTASNSPTKPNSVPYNPNKSSSTLNYGRNKSPLGIKQHRRSIAKSLRDLLDGLTEDQLAAVSMKLQAVHSNSEHTRQTKQKPERRIHFSNINLPSWKNKIRECASSSDSYKTSSEHSSTARTVIQQTENPAYE